MTKRELVDFMQLGTDDTEIVLADGAPAKAVYVYVIGHDPYIVITDEEDDEED